LPRTVHELVVIVMPAFTERDQREEKVVAALVFGFEGPGSPEVRQGID